MIFNPLSATSAAFRVMLVVHFRRYSETGVLMTPARTFAREQTISLPSYYRVG